jgi:CheY-like chemotaxis protein
MEDLHVVPALPRGAPAATAEATPTATSSQQLAPEDTATLDGRRVLLVEDDARNLYATTALLERHGVTVIPASNAKEAYSALQQHPDTDLVLMDVMMPEIDGYEATRHIRSMKAFASLPIVALTAKASKSDRAESVAAGCNEYVVKPAETVELLSVMARSLRR